MIGTVRSRRKEKKKRILYERCGTLSNLSFEIVKDISDPEAFEPFSKGDGEIEIALYAALLLYCNINNCEYYYVNTTDFCSKPRERRSERF